MESADRKPNFPQDIPALDAYLKGTLTVPETGMQLSAPEFPELPEFGSLDMTFSQKVMQLVDAAGLSPSVFYKQANLSRQVFHALNANPEYRPTRTTAFACAVGLRLSLEKTKELLLAAGYAFSHSIRTDVIVEYYIRNRIYDIDRINEALYYYDLQPLGSL